MLSRRTLLFLALGVPAAASPLSAAEGWKVGPWATFRHGDFKLHLAGYVQGDFRAFRDWGEGTEELHFTDSEVRRLRFGLEMEWGRFSAELTEDPRDDQGTKLKDGYGDLRLVKGLRIRAGQFKVPVGSEWLTSASKTDFVERALLASELGPGRDVGVMAHGSPGRVEYFAGWFLGDDRGEPHRAGHTAAARLVLSALQGLELGASASLGDVPAEPALPGVILAPKGLRGRGPTGFHFYDRHFVDGQRRRLGVDGAYTAGPVRLRFEGLHVREERQGQGSLLDDLSREIGRGWTASATWLVTGEQKRNTIRPRRPLPHGPGAIELGVRYEELRYDDDGPSSGFEGSGNRARNIRPAGDRIWTGGLSWWPVEWIRLMGDAILERFVDSLRAPESGRGGNYVTLVGRVQVSLR
jgi:phosphate-selective porin OprO and OprP